MKKLRIGLVIIFMVLASTFALAQFTLMTTYGFGVGDVIKITLANGQKVNYDLTRLLTSAPSVYDLVTYYPSTTKQVVYVEQFNSDHTGGGGNFRWKTDCTTSTGGTLIDPALINGWDGTVANLATTYYNSGSGQGSAAASGCWERIDSQGLVREFGLVGDGTTVETVALQAVVDSGIEEIHFGDGTYFFDSIRIPNGVTALIADGAKLKASANTSSLAMFTLEGLFYSTTPTSNLLVTGFDVDLNGLQRQWLFAGGGSFGCKVEKNTIYNFFGDSVTTSTGIRFHYSSYDNVVEGNTIILPVDIPFQTIASGVGIYFSAKAVSTYSGFESGAIVEPTLKPHGNKAIGNWVYNGTHGIVTAGADNNIFAENHLIDNSHRGVNIGTSSHYNQIIDNTIMGFGSAAVTLGYGSSHNQISGNNAYSRTQNGGKEACMQAYVATNYNTFSENKLDCSLNYGVYIAVEAVGNTVIGNDINASVLLRSALMIENDWVDTPPAAAVYSRDNYGVPPSGCTNIGGTYYTQETCEAATDPTETWNVRTVWGIADTKDNVFTDNIIRNPSAVIAAIGMAQINANSSLTGNIFEGTKVLGTTPTHYVHAFEETASSSVNNVLQDNYFSYENPTLIYMTQGRAAFKEVSGNSILNRRTGGDPFFAASLNTGVIDASKSDYISTGSYTAATDVTEFTGGQDGQHIFLRMSVFTTIKHDNAKIRMRGGVDYAGTSANEIIEFFRFSGIWFEYDRNFSDPVSKAGVEAVLTGEITTHSHPSAGSATTRFTIPYNYNYPPHVSVETSLSSYPVDSSTRNTNATYSYDGSASILMVTPDATDVNTWLGTSGTDYNITLIPNRKWLWSGWIYPTATGTFRPQLKTSDAGTHRAGALITFGSGDLNQFKQYTSIIDTSTDASPTAVMVFSDTVDNGSVYIDLVTLQPLQTGQTEYLPLNEVTIDTGTAGDTIIIADFIGSIADTIKQGSGVSLLVQDKAGDYTTSGKWTANCIYDTDTAVNCLLSTAL